MAETIGPDRSPSGGRQHRASRSPDASGVVPWPRPLVVALALVAMLLAVTPMAAVAATITVNDTGTAVNPDDSKCTLIEAIIAANTNATSPPAGECEAGSSSGTDTIVLQSGATYRLTNPHFPIPSTGPNGLPTVTTAITIQGNGAIVERSPDASEFRLFNVEEGGNLRLESLTVRGGRIAIQGGAGILVQDGSLSLLNSTVTNNVSPPPPEPGGGGTAGGGILVRSNLTTRIVNSVVSDNHADTGGGIDGLTSVTLEGSTLRNNTARYQGGGFYGTNLTLVDSTVENNSVTELGDHTTTRSGTGGGVSAGISLTVIGSTFRNNSAVSAGAIHVLPFATATVANSTISGNRSIGPAETDASGGFGGFGTAGIEMTRGGSLRLINSTVADNRADHESGAGGVLIADFQSTNGRLTLTNTILAGNQVAGSLTAAKADCGTGPEVTTGTTSNGHNLVGQGTGCPSDGTDDITVAPASVFTTVLEPLADNGGPTQTHALRSDSPAIDAADAAVCAAAPVGGRDQRDQPRGDPCDIGAFEGGTRVSSADLSVAMTDAPDPAEIGAAVTYTVTVTNGGPSAASGVTLTDTLPAGATFVSATAAPGGSGACTRADTTVTCNLGTLANGGQATVTIVVRPTAAGTIVNRASATSAVQDPVPANNEAARDTTVNAPPGPPPGQPPSSPPAANTPPTISDVPDQGTPENTPIAVSFTVNDAETPAASLVVTASSSNPILVPNAAANLALGGAGANRTLTVTPASGQSGATTIALTVQDAGGLTATDTFVLTVTPTPRANTPPTILAIPDQVTGENMPLTVGFTVGDAETAAAGLTVASSSTREALVPNVAANLAHGGAGAARTLAITPRFGESGRSTITVAVGDGAASATVTFLLTVRTIDTIGGYDPARGTFFFRHSNTAGPPDRTFTMSEGPVGQAAAGPARVPLAGDWNGNGEASIGQYDPRTGTFHLRNSDDIGTSNLRYVFRPNGANATWIPLVGDWDGNRRDTAGLYDPATGTFSLRNAHTSGPAQARFVFRPNGANASWLPLVGDWDGDGRDTVGLYDPATGRFFLRNRNSAGPADNVATLTPHGGAGLKPVVGDWDGDGKTTTGTFDPTSRRYRLRNANTTGPADLTFVAGPNRRGLVPLAGDWNNGPGDSGPGRRR